MFRISASTFVGAPTVMQDTAVAVMGHAALVGFAQLAQVITVPLHGHDRTPRFSIPQDEQAVVLSTVQVPAPLGRPAASVHAVPVPSPMQIAPPAVPAVPVVPAVPPPLVPAVPPPPPPPPQPT